MSAFYVSLDFSAALRLAPKLIGVARSDEKTPIGANRSELG